MFVNWLVLISNVHRRAQEIKDQVQPKLRVKREDSMKIIILLIDMSIHIYYLYSSISNISFVTSIYVAFKVGQTCLIQHYSLN